MSDDSYAPDSMQLRVYAFEAVGRFAGLENGAEGNAKAAKLCEVLGVENYLKLCATQEKYADTMRLLIGPNGYTVYKMLLARKSLP